MISARRAPPPTTNLSLGKEYLMVNLAFILLAVCSGGYSNDSHRLRSAYLFLLNRISWLYLHLSQQN